MMMKSASQPTLYILWKLLQSFYNASLYPWQEIFQLNKMIILISRFPTWRMVSFFASFLVSYPSFQAATMEMDLFLSFAYGRIYIWATQDYYSRVVECIVVWRSENMNFFIVTNITWGGFPISDNKWQKMEINSFFNSLSAASVISLIWDTS